MCFYTNARLSTYTNRSTSYKSVHFFGILRIFPKMNSAIVSAMDKIHTFDNPAYSQ